MRRDETIGGRRLLIRPSVIARQNTLIRASKRALENAIGRDDAEVMVVGVCL